MNEPIWSCVKEIYDSLQFDNEMYNFGRAKVWQSKISHLRFTDSEKQQLKDYLTEWY